MDGTFEVTRTRDSKPSGAGCGRGLGTGGSPGGCCHPDRSLSDGRAVGTSRVPAAVLRASLLLFHQAQSHSFKKVSGCGAHGARDEWAPFTGPSVLTLGPSSPPRGTHASAQEGALLSALPAVPLPFLGLLLLALLCLAAVPRPRAFSRCPSSPGVSPFCPHKLGGDKSHVNDVFLGRT